VKALASQIGKVRYDKMLSVLDRRVFHVAVAVENLQDPHNGSAILRTCDGLGVQRVYAVEQYAETEWDSKSVTSGSRKWITLQRFKDTKGFIDHAKFAGGQLIGLELAPDALDFSAVPWQNLLDSNRETCLVFGNETRGLSKTLSDACDVRVRLPNNGFVQSFNLSVTCGMMLFYLQAQGFLTVSDDVWHCSESERIRLLEKWLLRDVKYSREYLARIGVPIPLDF
jgi:tRNA (guanosine-2'-O-)-methyltransferase